MSGVNTERLETFARRWRDVAIGTEGQVRHGYRQTLATEYGVTPHTIDKWTRQARDAGMLPEAKRSVVDYDKIRAKLAQRRAQRRGTQR